MRYVINLLAALGLFYSGFVHTFWGNDPYLGWAITIIAAFIIAEPFWRSWSVSDSQVGAGVGPLLAPFS